MTRPHLSYLPEGAALQSQLAALIPRLETERLTLRVPNLSDYDVLEPIWRSDRGAFIGGPFTEEDAFFDFANAVAGWLLRGVGCWTLERKSDSAVLGLMGFGFEPGDPELEFGWLLTHAAEGHGYAQEAGRVIHAFAFETLGLSTLISLIDRRNSRSIALAERLGAVKVAAADGPLADTLIYRHYPKGDL